ncbi:MAG: SMC-Scp complex subunit ScpB [Halanaerobiales bacterium]|nr:SMC-Scp complex subunit ScpB [Halanaerobiales bacterium]
MDLHYKQLVEALLFIATDPLTPAEIERVVGITKTTVIEMIEILKNEYDETDRGFQIRKVGKGYSICTRPEFAEYIRELYQPKVKQRLTQAALETLAIIAYKQPITRAEIEDIRGVKVEKALITLQKRGLVQDLGRKQTIGTPIIYGTTDAFLQYFDLGDLCELPEPADFSLLEEKAFDDEEIEEYGKFVEEVKDLEYDNRPLLEISD